MSDENPRFCVLERERKMTKIPKPPFGERIPDLGNSDSAVGDDDIEVCSNFVGDTKTEIENPNNPVVVLGGGERNEEVIGNSGSSDSIGDMENVGNSEVRERKSVVVMENRENDNNIPPLDDICPICCGNFTHACKTNCGHWFCASCILQFWNYKASLQKCKCPICSRLISNLTPEAFLLSRQEKEVIEVLKNVHRYNRLFQGGAHGLLQNVLELPLHIKRMLQGLMDPDRFRVNYYTARFVALLLGIMYNISPFDFIPTGGLGARKLFDLCAIALVFILCLVGLCHRVLIRQRLGRLAAAHTLN